MINKPKNPFRAALHEARVVLVAAVLIAVAYNLFASTGVPWVREIRHEDTVAYEQLFLPSTTPSVDTPATAPAAVMDTAIQPMVTDTDSTAEALTKPDATETKRIQDSIKNAKAEAVRLRDSARTAQQKPTKEPEQPLKAEISIATAKRLLDEKRALFIDARPASQFAEGHIPGAINIYATDFRDHIPTLLRYSMDTLIVTYCGGGLCELSHELADQIRTLGFKKVVVFTGGTTEWNEKNYPFTSDK